MQHKINAQGAVVPVVLGVIAVTAIIAVIVWAVQSPSSQSGINAGVKLENENRSLIKADDAMMEKNTKDNMIEKSDGDAAMEKTDEGAMMEKQNDTMAKAAPTGYIIYSSQAYADAKDQKRVLFFHASWCPTCRAANADLTANVSKIPSNVVVFKTDYDTESTLKSVYGITYQHTFVQVDANGKAVAKWNGGGFDEILKNIN